MLAQHTLRRNLRSTALRPSAVARRRRSGLARDHAPRSPVGDAARCLVEAMEHRVLLSGGDPDLAFGDGGVASAYFVDAELVAMDTRLGKTLAVGAAGALMHLVRFDGTGRIDPTFGEGTVIQTTLMMPKDVFIQPDGKILIGGTIGDNPDFGKPGVARLTETGEVDHTFGGGDGVAPLSFEVREVQSGPGGTVVAAGFATRADGKKYFAAGRMTAAGMPDPAFNGTGEVVTGWHTERIPVGLAVQPDGKVVLAGNPFNPNAEWMPGDPEWSPYDAAVMRLTAAGAPDPAFGAGGGGIVFTGIDEGNAFSAALTAGGSVVVGMRSGLQYVQLMKVNPTGGSVSAFEPLYTDGYPAINDVRVATDGKVVAFVSGLQFGGNGGPNIVVRYNASGTIDRTFAPGLGYRPVPGAIGDLQGDNKIVVAAPFYNKAGVGVTLTRYWYAAGPDPSGISLSAVDGTLTVNGTAGDDYIELREVNPKYQVGEPTDPNVVVRVRVNDYYRGFTPATIKKAVVNAGGGNDTVAAFDSRAPAAINGGPGEDTLYGGRGNDRIDGGADNDWVDAGEGYDTVLGGDHDDILHGGPGNDLLDGGAGSDGMSGNDGDDTADYSTRTRGVSVTFNGVDHDDDGERPNPATGLPGEGDTVLSDVENAIGGGGDDVLVGSAAANVLRGNGGSDWIEGNGGNDVLDGGADNDSILGHAGNDRLTGGTGHDNLDGGTGADDLSGGDGTDTLYYEGRTGGVTVGLGSVADDGEAGERDNARSDAENVIGGMGDDVFYGTAARNFFRGGGGNDRLYGRGGDDMLFGDAGNDLLSGEAGNDRLDGGAGADDMSGGLGTDTLDYGARTGALYVGLGNVADDGEAGERDNARADNEIVVGGAGNDTLVGNAFANVFYGNGGDDTLYGRGGNDALWGGPGRNRLIGEDGSDTLYARNNAADLVDGGAGFDKAQKDALDAAKGVEQLI